MNKTLYIKKIQDICRACRFFCRCTFMLLVEAITSPLRVVRPGEVGKLLRGGGGGGDLDGFSVRYLATVSSSDPRLEPPSLLETLCVGC